MTRSQQIKHIKDKLKVYKDDKFVNLTLDGNKIYATNKCTGCKHIFVDGSDNIVLPRGIKLEDVI